MNWFENTTKRTQMVGIALLLGTFAAGGLAGFAAERELEDRQTDRVEAEDRDKDHRRWRERYFDRLDLNEEQRREANRILDRRHEQMRAFWDEHGPELRSIVDSTRVELRAILTPEQRELAERLRRERKERKSRYDGEKNEGEKEQG